MAHILVVDDESAVREALSGLLVQLGHTVTEAADGQEALECFERGEFDLILTDVIMPRMNGFELIQQVQMRIHHRIPLVVLSSHSDNDGIRGAIYAGAFDYIMKPAQPSRVAAVLERALAQGRVWAAQGTPPPAPVPVVTDTAEAGFETSGCAAMAPKQKTVTVPKPGRAPSPSSPSARGPWGRIFDAIRRR